MKVYTSKDLKSFERNDNGELICPTGNYSQIKHFGEHCTFGHATVLQKAVISDK